MTNAQTREVLGLTTGLTVALMFHLRTRHFPPINPVFEPAVKIAIDAAAEADFDQAVELPNGRTLAAAEVVNQLHLWDLVEARIEGRSW